MLAARGSFIARSFVRCPVRTSCHLLTYSQVSNARRYTSPAPASPPGRRYGPIDFFSFMLATATGTYIYHTYFGSKPEIKQEKSPLDPENFVDFKLKRVVPYNHNTSK